MNEKETIKLNQKVNLKKNAFLNIIISLSTIVFPIITFPYLSRVILADGVGKVNFALSVISYFIVIAQLGIPTYGIIQASRYKNDRVKLAKVVQELLVINIVTIVFSYTILFFFLGFSNLFYSYEKILLILSLNIFFTSFGMEWFYRGIEMYDKLLFRTLFVKAIAIICVFVFINSQSDYILYALILAVSGMIGNIFCFRGVSKYIALGKIQSEYNFYQHIKPIFLLAGMSIVKTLYTNIDKTMLGFIIDDNAVGLYTAANKMIKALVTVVIASITVLLPAVASHLKNKDEEKVHNIIKKSFNFVLIISLPTVIGVWFLAEPIIYFFSGEDFLESTNTIRILAVMIVAVGISNITGIQILIVRGKERFTLYSMIMGLVVNVVLNVILIPLIGVTGAALATVLAEITITSVQIVYCREYLKNIITIKNIVQYFFGFLIVGIVCFTVALFVTDYLLVMILSLVIAPICYFVFLLMVRNEFVIQVFNDLIRKKGNTSN